MLPPLAEGDRLELKALRPEQKFTQPPPRFTEATLVKELEENGIGRPSTYASIIGVLQDRDYANKVEGKFKPTALGMIITDLLIKSFDDILDVEYTRSLEEDLDRIEQGKANYKGTLTTFYKKFKKDLAKAGKEMQNLKEGIKTEEICDRCGKGMVIKVGKFGPFVACSGYPDCTNTRELEKSEPGADTDETQDETCENCGKPMVVKRGRFGQFLACTGYPDCKTTRKIISSGGAMKAAKPDQILEEKCPKCDSFLVIKQGRFGEFTACTNYPNCKYVKMKTTGRALPQGRRRHRRAEVAPRQGLLRLRQLSRLRLHALEAPRRGSVPRVRHAVSAREDNEEGRAPARLQQRRLRVRQGRAARGGTGACLMRDDSDSGLGPNDSHHRRRSWRVARLPGRPHRAACPSPSTKCGPTRPTEVHKTDRLAELVCSNSFRGDKLDNAVGLLKEEMRRLDSLVMHAAEIARVPAGAALAVDRELFARTVTQAIHEHPLITLAREEITSIPAATTESPVIIATGPLTSPALSAAIVQLVGNEHLYFYDAISPIVLAETIDMKKVFRASRWDRSVRRDPGIRDSGLGISSERLNAPKTCGIDDGEGDYLNCPMSAEEYRAFYAALSTAESATVHDFDKEKFFEGCLPIEVMAHRGEDTLRFGPMKPVGLKDPRTGRQPYAVVQLRQDNLAGDHYSLVGFQTQLKWGEQARVLRMIPGLEQAEFVRYGMVHRNTYINGPTVLLRDVANAVESRALLRRPDFRRRGLCRVGGVGIDGGAQCRSAGVRSGDARAAADDGHRRAGVLRLACQPARLSTVEHHVRDYGAAGTAHSRQAEAQARDLGASAARAGRISTQRRRDAETVF